LKATWHRIAISCVACGLFILHLGQSQVLRSQNMKRGNIMKISAILAKFRVHAVGRYVYSLLLLAFVLSSSLYFSSRQAQAQAGASLEGFHDIANCGEISGWAWDSAQPNTPINVEIYADNVLLTTIPADQFRQDLLNAGKGTGFHAFSFPTPNSLKDGQPHSILVRFANTNISLGNSPKSITCSTSAFEGFHDGVTCDKIFGWAWDASQPNTPINVDVYFDNEQFISIQAPANQFRQDLLNAGKGNGIHGFSFSTPARIKDGLPHTVTIKFSGTNTNLFNTPRTVTCGPTPPPAYEGFHDSADCNSIVGWAWDANQPNTPISVDIYDGGTIIATVLANEFRQGLLDAGKGNGVHGFTFPVPASLKDGQPHLISVGFAGTKQGLYNTPKTINCTPASPVFEGFHDSADCNSIVGWAWDATQPNTPISVDIYSDNVLVMTVLANQFRQGLLDAGKGNGVHGFVFTVPGSLKDGLPHSIRVKYAGTNIDLSNTPKSITCAP
jgi:hypothetical protein